MHILTFLFKKEETDPMYSSHLRIIGRYRKAIQVFQLVFSALEIWHAVASNNGINIIRCKL